MEGQFFAEVLGVLLLLDLLADILSQNLHFLHGLTGTGAGSFVTLLVKLCEVVLDGEDQRFQLSVFFHFLYYLCRSNVKQKSYLGNISGD